MAVCCESGDGNKNVSNAQCSIRVAALPYGGHFFDPCVARCRECNDSWWVVGKPYLWITSRLPVTRPELQTSHSRCECRRCQRWSRLLLLLVLAFGSYKRSSR